VVTEFPVVFEWTQPFSSSANVPRCSASMPLSCGMSDVTRRRGEVEEGDEHALTAVAKATADPRMTSLDHRVGMGGVYPRLMNKSMGSAGAVGHPRVGRRPGITEFINPSINGPLSVTL
jgi:hypothetical protein